MAFDTTLPRNDYVGTGALDAYDFTFRIFAATDLRVTKLNTDGVETALVYPTDFTVPAGDINNHSGGTLTLTAGNLPLNYGLTIRFDRQPKQSTDLRNQGSYFLETHEDKFDELTRYVQAVRDVLSRALHLQETEVGTELATTIPSVALRASKFAFWDSSGNITPVDALTQGVLAVSAYAQTILDDANAAAARATLGVPTLAEVLAAAVVADTVFRVTGSLDTTKLLAHQVDALTTLTTRTRFEVDEDVSVGQSWEAKNLSIVATVASNALTVALKTKNDTDPSATDPILFKFRNATIGTGDYTTMALTAALSLVISSGSTLGTVSGAAHRLYLGVANDGGTLRLFLYNPLVAATLSLAGLHDAQVYSSTAEGGAGAADSAQVLYSGTAFTSKAIRLLGYVESTQATAGTWATTPSKIQILGPGVKRTADRVQTQVLVDGAVATGTTVLPSDDTIPQNTEGDQYLTKSITPSSSLNLLHIESVLALASSTNDQYTVALFQDAIANALAVMQNTFDTTGRVYSVAVEHFMAAGTVSSITFNVRAGNTAAGTTTFNGAAGARKMGGVMKSFLRITEIMV
jgi:hypothetical protein